MSDASDPKVVWHPHTIGRTDREELRGHAGCVAWFTGLSGSGKSTVANLAEQLLWREGIQTFLLDGDNVRHGLCAPPKMLEAEHGAAFSSRFGLGFSPLDREENIRRVGAISQLFVEAGMLVLTAFVSPYRRDRQRVRDWIVRNGSTADFAEIFVDTPLEICEQRDPKGLYKQAREGKIPHFTGISDPYEPPESPELVLQGGMHPPEALAEQVADFLKSRIGWKR